MKPIFNIDLKKFSVEVLPTFLRGDILRAFIFAAIRPLLDILINFMVMMEDSNFKLAHGSQIYSICKVLNDALDNDARRFRIERVFVKEYLEVYRRSESKSVVLGRHLLYQRHLIGAELVDFIVIAPGACRHDEIKIKSLVDYYKLAGKRYTIQYKNE